MYIKVFFLIILFFFACTNEYQDAVKSKPVFSKEQMAQLKLGKDLFLRHCVSCHNVDMRTKSTASALGGVTERHTKEWLRNFTKNPQKMYKQGDTLAIKVFEKGFLMPSFEFLTDAELDAIYFFVEQTALENKIRLRPVER